MLNNLEHLSALAADNAAVALCVRHDRREHRCLCSRLDMFLMKARQKFCRQKRGIAAEHHDCTALLCEQLLCLEDRMSRAELLALLHILDTVTDGRPNRLAAKARNNDIAPCACRIRRIDDMLQHGLPRCTVQHLRQL